MVRCQYNLYSVGRDVKPCSIYLSSAPWQQCVVITCWHKCSWKTYWLLSFFPACRVTGGCDWWLMNDFQINSNINWTDTPSHTANWWMSLKQKLSCRGKDRTTQLWSHKMTYRLSMHYSNYCHYQLMCIICQATAFTPLLCFEYWQETQYVQWRKTRNTPYHVFWRRLFVWLQRKQNNVVTVCGCVLNDVIIWQLSFITHDTAHLRLWQ